MKTNARRTKNHLVIFRLLGIATLLGIFFVFSWKDTEENNPHAPTAQNGLSLISAWWDRLEKNPALRTTTARNDSPVTTSLAGHFTPDDEKVLIQQLTRAGYRYLCAYHFNEDGSAVISAIRDQQAIQPIVTITVNKDGKAASTE
ncbi:MAG: hypothetical protein WC073_13875 [Sterolibacterium sp.]